MTYIKAPVSLNNEKKELVDFMRKLILCFLFRNAGAERMRELLRLILWKDRTSIPLHKNSDFVLYLRIGKEKDPHK